MMETIGSLIRYLVIIIFLSALLEMLLPQGTFRRYLRMLVGILLIFTLLAPLQKIMRLAPYWEWSFLSKEVMAEGDLESILKRGREMYRDNIYLALEEYRQRIFSLLERELAGKWGYKLLRLELVLDENPENASFGSIKEIYAEVQRMENSKKVQSGERVKEIKINIELAEPQGNNLEKGRESSDARGENQKENNDEMHRFIAAFFQLPAEKVAVRILP